MLAREVKYRGCRSNKTRTSSCKRAQDTHYPAHATTDDGTNGYWHGTKRFLIARTRRHFRPGEHRKGAQEEVFRVEEFGVNVLRCKEVTTDNENLSRDNPRDWRVSVL